VPNSEGITWKPSGYYEGKSANEILPMHSPSLGSYTSSTGADSCKGDFEIFMRSNLAWNTGKEALQRVL
jgi:hypothetical protein